MLRLVSDENFNGEVVRGLLRRQSDLDLVRVQDVGLLGADDPAILAWAASEGRILLTHDRSTVPDFAYDRVRAGEPMAGVFIVNDRMPIGQAIDEILLLALCSESDEWKDRVEFLPL
jgi:predicted nuclease of predicted toxin-antitoxin system